MTQGNPTLPARNPRLTRPKPATSATASAG